MVGGGTRAGSANLLPGLDAPELTFETVEVHLVFGLQAPDEISRGVERRCHQYFRLFLSVLVGEGKQAVPQFFEKAKPSSYA